MEVLLLSGGIESTCLAYIRKPQVCLTIDYGQIPAAGEIRAAINIASFLSLSHEVVRIDASDLGSGQLAGKEKLRDALIPEFWPFRNQFLLTVAAMKFIEASPLTIVIGSVAADSSHKDGTAEFVKAIDALMVMQEGHANVIAPAILSESLDLLRKSSVDPDILDMTFSCFVSEYPCGRCRGCVKNEELRAAYYADRPTC